MEKLRYLNKHTNLQERINFSGWWREQIEIYGQEISYYSNTTTLSASYFLYGEDPAAGFNGPKEMTVLLNLNNDALLLSKFGILADSDMAGVIHPYHYTTIYGLSSEPKAGDVIKLSEFGNDRLNYPKRGPTVYQLTEVIDEFQGNPIAGHYVWFFKAKRYNYSLGTNDGPGSGQGNNPLDDNNSANQAAEENFDYLNDNPCDNTSVYGSY
ncbi:hypothetical protein EBU91_03220 [bacterium]|nr:hypothetical protein [bacterium]